ncbi:MAG: hypothetical protein GXY06_03145 [Clostridiaceae bacterium]|nr:hypothetical protein [Clostridiaceae bacterium]
MVDFEDFYYHNTSSPGIAVSDPIFREKEPDLEVMLAAYDEVRRSGVTVVALSSDAVGVGDEPHGRELMMHFLERVCNHQELPDEVLVYHRGVLLFEKGSKALRFFEILCDMEVVVKACGESLERYGIDLPIRKIRTVSMAEITTSLLRADRVVRP